MISDGYYTCHACGSSDIELVPRDESPDAPEYRDEEGEFENYYECHDCGDCDLIA